MFFDVNRFHIFVLIAWQFTSFFATQLIFSIFSNYIPQFQCGDGPISRNCSEFARCGGNVTYYNVDFSSAAIEYGWICSNTSYLTYYFAQIQYFGVLLGTISFGSLSDKFGRKPISILALSLGIACIYVTGQAKSVELLFAIRFGVGLAIGGALVVICTFCMELLLPNQRMVLRAFFNWGWSRMLLTVVCYLLPEWRQASTALALLALPALFIILFVLPESPTWLHSKGRITEMHQSEQHMAKWAGVEYVPVVHSKLIHNKPFCELIQSGGLMRRLLVLWFMWFTTCLCGYAIDLNSNTLSGDLFLNQTLFSILTGLSKMVLITLDTTFASFSRRLLHQGAQSVVIFCFLILTVLTVTEHKGVSFLVINIIGLVFIEYTWDANYLCAIESMETSSRASATGSCSLVARVGALIAPMLAYANSTWPPAVYVTVVVMGTMNLVASYCFLVETKGINLDEVKLNEDENDEANTEMIEKNNI